MHRFVLASLTLAVTTLAAPTANADCAMWGLTPKVLTPNNAVLTSAAGGIVVAAVPQPGDRLDKGDTAVQTSWRFKGNRKAPAITSLAPGLAVIGVPMQASVELDDATGKRLVTVQAPAAEEQRKAAAAPKIKQATYKLNGMLSYHGSEAVDLVLDAPMPANTVAVILLDDKGGKSFGLVNDPKAMTVTAYSQQSCQVLPNGTRPSKTGDVVKVQFVEADGFVSAPSAKIKITAAP